MSANHNRPVTDVEIRVKDLESLLVEKGPIDVAAVDALIDTYEHKIGPRNGAHVVARAWVDPEYEQRLLTDGTKAIAELGYTWHPGRRQGRHRKHRRRAQCHRVHPRLFGRLWGCHPSGSSPRPIVRAL